MKGFKVAFLGGLFPKELEDEISKCSKSQPQNAANVFQWNLVDGMDRHLEEPVTLLNAMFLGAYPKLYTEPKIHGGTFNHSADQDHKDYQLPFLNLPGIKHFSRLRAFRSAIRRHLCEEEYRALVGYSMTPAVVWGLLYAKKIMPEVVTCLVVPDLPQYMNMGKQPLGARILKGVINKLQYQGIQNIDTFVVLTEYMPAALGIAHKPYVVIEGVASPKPVCNEAAHNTKDIVYTGAMQMKYGVGELVDAFCRLEGPELRLVLCGGGDAATYIEERAKCDKRICYHGVVPHSQIRKIQESAYLLVNPRSSEGEYTKYSFPSKTMEYMDAGRPVVMYPLPGIPAEYAEYLVYVEPEEDGLYRALQRALKQPKDQLDAIGLAGKQFVSENKNSMVQCGRLLNMLRQISARSCL